MTVERYLTVKIKNWRKVYFKSKQALLVSITLIIAYFLYELPLLFPSIHSEPIYLNGTLLYSIYDFYNQDELVQLYTKVCLYVY